MLEQIFLVVYGLTVAFFGMGFTLSVFKGRWDKKMKAAAEHTIQKIESSTGYKLEEKPMILFIEFSSVLIFILPFVNTICMVKGFINGWKTRQAIKATIDKHTDFLD